MQSGETIPEWKRVLLEKQRAAAGGQPQSPAADTNETPSWQNQRLNMPGPVANNSPSTAESARAKYEARKSGIQGTASPRPGSGNWTPEVKDSPPLRVSFGAGGTSGTDSPRRAAINRAFASPLPSTEENVTVSLVLSPRVARKETPDSDSLRSSIDSSGSCSIRSSNDFSSPVTSIRSSNDFSSPSNIRISNETGHTGDYTNDRESASAILQRVQQKKVTAPVNSSDLPEWKKNLMNKNIRKSSTEAPAQPSPRGEERPSWVKQTESDPESSGGIDWHSHLVTPGTIVPPAKVTHEHHDAANISEAEISQLPAWQQRLIQRKTQESTSAADHANAREAYQTRSAIKTGAEPLIQGVPAWKQRVLQSKARVEASVGTMDETKAMTELQAFQKRLLAPKAERHTTFGPSPPVSPRTSGFKSNDAPVFEQGETIDLTLAPGAKRAAVSNRFLQDMGATRNRLRTQSLFRRKEDLHRADHVVKVEFKFGQEGDVVEDSTLSVSLAMPLLVEEVHTETVKVEAASLASLNVLEDDLQSLDLSAFLLPKIVIPKIQPLVVEAPKTDEVKEPPKPKTEAEIRKLIEAEEKMVKAKPQADNFKKAVWHEQYKALGVVNGIMAKEGFTLEDLLKESDATVLIAANPKDNKKLLVFLRQPANVLKMLNHIGEEPVLASLIPESDIPVFLQKLKVTEACLQIVQQTEILQKKIITECIARFCEIMEQTKSFVVFARLVQLLQIIILLDVKAVAAQLLKQPNFMSSIISKVGTEAALSEDVLMVIRLFTNAAKKVPDIVDWFLDANVPELLTQRLAPQFDSVVHEESAHILGEILAEIKMNAGEKSTSELPPIAAGLIEQFRDEHNIDNLFQYAHDSPCSMLQIMSLFETCLEADIEGDDSIILLKFIDNLTTFLDLLLPMENNIKFVKNSTGDVPSFGLLRLAVLQFILLLVTEEPEIGCVLVESGFYGLVFELVFDYPMNNVIHDVVLQFFLLLCTRDEDEIMEVFVSTNLLDRLGTVWEKFYSSSETHFGYDKVAGKNVPPAISYGKVVEIVDSKTVEKFPAYFGHLAVLANMVNDLTEEKEALNELIDMSDKWKEYTVPYLDNYNLAMINMTSV